MKLEVPSFYRCCMCIPLRYGLLFWGYLKLISSLAVFGLMIKRTVVIIEMTQHKYMPLEIFMVLGSIIAVSLVDACFSITFICGGHQKKPKLLKIYYVYSIVLLVLLILVLIGVIVQELIIDSRRVDNLIQYKLPSVLLNIVIHLYFIFLLRSEILKLYNIRDNAQYTIHTNDNEGSTCNVKIFGKKVPNTMQPENEKEKILEDIEIS